MTRDTEPSLSDIADAAIELAELRATADGVLGRIWSVDRTRALLDTSGPAFDRDVWRTVVELGWPDVLIAESSGGGGGGIRELCVLVEAAGAAALPLPLGAVAAAGWCEQRCASGITLVLPGVDATLDAGTISGRWQLVPFGAVADRLIVMGRRDGEPVLGVVDTAGPGVQRELERPLDHNPAACITMSNAVIDTFATGSDALSRHREAVNRLRLATAAELTGIASAANDAAVAYAKMRSTFGRPIGTRQAIKHRLVDQRSVIEIARALINRAADANELDHADAEALLSLAVFWAVDSLRRVPEGATQVFGGIAYTWEHDAHVHLRRAATRVAELGPRDLHRAVVADWLRAR